jgi:hypothetical protein
MPAGVPSRHAGIGIEAGVPIRLAERLDPYRRPCLGNG